MKTPSRPAQFPKLKNLFLISESLSLRRLRLSLSHERTPSKKANVQLTPTAPFQCHLLPLLNFFAIAGGNRINCVGKSGKMDNFGYIPEDVIIKIFIRLPVKSLLRFKCVSKSWCFIIASCSFIYEHLDMALADSRKAHLLVMHRPSETSDFFLFTNDQLMTPTHLTVDTKFSHYFRIMGPCHGLLCLFDLSELCLWNPATREIKYIPESPIPIPSEVDEYEDVEFGFGFDYKTRDYKVVKLLRKRCKDRDNDYHVEVYTLSTNSWRKIDVVVPSRLFSYHLMYSFTAYKNGTFYWWAETVIVCFDMSNEQFGMIHLPKVDFPLNEVEIWKSNCFTEYNGSLAVIFYFRNENDTWSELWTMNGHGMTVTWTKQFSIGWLEGWLRPIWSYKNNRILFVDGYFGGDKNTIIPYDHEARSVQIAFPVDPEIRMDSNCQETIAAYYTESLVSLGDG